MEWGNLPKQTDEEKKIIEMIDFLQERKFIAYGNNAKLEKDAWKSWPWDIIWKK